VRLPNQEEEDYLMIQETNKNALEVAETGLHEFLVKQNANLD
jgi:hypothetical protein